MSILGSNIARITTLLLLLSGAPLAVPATAQARAHVRPDPLNDVVKSGNRVTPAPNQPQTDLISTAFRHKTTRVRIRLTLDDLQIKRGDQYGFIATRLVTNTGLERDVDIFLERGSTDIRMYNEEGDFARCALHHSIDYRNDVVVIGFSRRCVGYPRWVRIAAEVRNSAPADPNMGPDLYVDHALRGALENDDFPPPFSPRIYRGTEGPGT